MKAVKGLEALRKEMKRKQANIQKTLNYFLVKGLFYLKTGHDWLNGDSGEFPWLSCLQKKGRQFSAPR